MAWLAPVINASGKKNAPTVEDTNDDGKSFCASAGVILFAVGLVVVGLLIFISASVPEIQFVMNAAPVSCRLDRVSLDPLPTAATYVVPLLYVNCSDAIPVRDTTALLIAFRTMDYHRAWSVSDAALWAAQLPRTNNSAIDLFYNPDRDPFLVLSLDYSRSFVGGIVWMLALMGVAILFVIAECTCWAAQERRRSVNHDDDQEHAVEGHAVQL